MTRVVVASFSTPAQAHVALTRLQSAGVEATIRDEFTVSFNWLVSQAVGGVKIEVAEEDAEAARAVLGEAAPEEGVLRCPFCGSSETRVRDLSAWGAVCVLLKLPVPMRVVVVDCRRCGKTHEAPIAGR